MAKIKAALTAALVLFTISGCSASQSNDITVSSTDMTASEKVSAENLMMIPSDETMPVQEADTDDISDNSDDSTEKDPNKITFTFLGDCILSTNEGDIRPGTFKEFAEQNPPSYFFEKAAPYYENSDFVIANSEFVLSDKELVKKPKEGTAFWFRSPTSYTDIFTSGGIDMVSIANNHTGDYGDEGYADTKAALDSAGLLWGDLDNPVYTEINGKTFGIICTKLFHVGFDTIIMPQIEEVKKNSDVQILFFHGGTEKEHIAEDWLTTLCHKYADAGIDLIVGSHPHVLRPYEEYNGVDIFYSIGNFCYGAHRQPENRTVILNETFCFDDNNNLTETTDQIIPFYVYSGISNNWQPCPITDPAEISKTLAFMYSGSGLPY